MKSLKTILLVITLVSFLGVSLVAAAAPKLLKFSHVVATDTPKGKAAEFFAEKVEELTDGEVKVQVYPNSTLYKDKEEMEALRLGSLEFLAPSLAKFGPLGITAFEVFDLPYMFDGYEELHKITLGSVGKELFKMLETKGIIGLAYWDNGLKSFSANEPIKNPKDLKGKKMRIQSSKVLEAQMRALGALPQIMAFSEVYHALQTGVVDGTENPMSNFSTQKFYEVQEHLTLSEHGYLGYAVVTNAKFWKTLDPKLRSQLTQAMDEASKYANKIAKEKSDSDLELVRKSGKTKIYQLTAMEKEAFKKALLPVHKEMEGRIGKDVIQAVYKALGK